MIDLVTEENCGYLGNKPTIQSNLLRHRTEADNPADSKVLVHTDNDGESFAFTFKPRDEGLPSKEQIARDMGVKINGDA